jgi:hypothetical protein
MKANGTSSVRAGGEHWVIEENKGEVFGSEFTGVLTIGYNAEKKKHLATWIDSMNSHMVMYESAMNDAGTILTLSTEAPNRTAAGKLPNSGT